MGTHRLLPHPATPPKGIDALEVRWSLIGNGPLILRYHVHRAEALALPEFAGKGRADGLWERSCFELFLRDKDSAGYREFNFSPSERWAAYRFAGYRESRTDLDLAVAPDVSPAMGDYIYVLTVKLDPRILDGAGAAGLSAVIDEHDGTRSYWALAHGGGEPDFHDPACFALPLG